MNPNDMFEFSKEDLKCNSLSTFVEMRKKGEFCDVVIKVGHKFLKGHRLILASAIPYFKTIFRYNCLENSREKVIIKGLNPKAVDCLINFIYTGDLKVQFLNLRSMLEASIYLQLDYVTSAIINFLTDRMKSDNVFTIRAWAEDICNEELLENADQYISENFDEASITKDFLDLPFHVVRDIISRDDLTFQRQANIFESVMRWVRACEFGRSFHLPDLLHNIRMHLMSPEDIMSASENTLIKKCQSCMDIVDQARQFHLLREKNESYSELEKHRFTPIGFTIRGQYCQKKNMNCSHKLGYGLYSVHFTEPSMLRISFFDQILKKWISLCQLFCTYPRYFVCRSQRIYIIHHAFVTVLNLHNTEDSYIKFTKTPAFAGVTLHKSRIYFLGGGYLNIGNYVQYFDTESIRCVEEGNMITNRKCPGAASLEDNIYITGGLSQGGKRVLKAAEKYDSTTGLSSEISPMLSGRWRHSCCALQDKIYAFGGFRRYEDSESSITTTCQVYDPQVDQWSFVRNMNTVKHCMSFFSLQNKIYVIDAKFKNESHVEADVYDPRENDWISADCGFLGDVSPKTTILFENSATAVF